MHRLRILMMTVLLSILSLSGYCQNSESYSKITLQEINEAIARGNEYIERYKNCSEQSLILGKTVSVMQEQASNYDNMLLAKDQQISILILERDTYKTLNTQ